MPVQPPGVWGIDLGQCGLKAIRLQESDGQLVATAFDYVEHPKILSQPDADPDQLIREALEKFLSRNSLRGDIVAISVPGQSGLARFVKLPPVEEKKIADIVRFEAKQQIPFNLEEVVWDYQKIGSGVVTDGFAMETEIGLFAMKRDMVNRYLQHFKDVGVEVHLVQMAPLALCNFVSYDLLGKDPGSPPPEGGGTKNCVVAMDIGADSSNLVITDGERIIWQRPIPLGGNHFTRALTKDLKLTFAKAEHLKRNATKSPDLKRILAALKPVLNDFVGEVQRSLGYFTNTHRDARIDYMVGLGNAFRLPGLQKFLSEKLQLDVRKLAKMERLGGDQVVTQQVYTENVLTFAVAYGLALQGLKRARLLTNLLPGEIRVERLVRAKKPFAVAAAGALLLAIGGLHLDYGLQKRTYGDSRVEAARKKSDAVSEQADKAMKSFKAIKDKAEEEEKAVKTIVAGQFERDNWLQLFKFVSAAVPQPNGDEPRELLVPGQKKPLTIPDIPLDIAKAREYWGEKGKKAYQEYRKRQAAASSGEESGKSGESEELGRGIDDLIQFNIESIDGYFCDNLGNYWDRVKAGGRVKTDRGALVQPAEDYGKKPEGFGWVIAVQGYTYHRDAETFIRNTLLVNLARLGIQKPAEPAKDEKGGTPPATTPAATPPPAPAAPAGQAQPTESAPLPDMGPVINRISHVVLFDYRSSSSNGALELIGRGQVARELASSGGAGGMGIGMLTTMPGGAGAGSGGAGEGGGSGGEGEKAAPAGPTRDQWEPLGSRGTGPGIGLAGSGAAGKMPAAGMMGSGAMAPGGKGGKFGPMMVGPGMGSGDERRPITPEAMLPGANAPTDTTTRAEGGHTRTEFVILFIWKEPTPSDALRGQTLPGEAAGEAGGAPAQTPSPQPSLPQPTQTPAPESRPLTAGGGLRDN